MLNAYPYDYFVRSKGIFPIKYALFKPLPEVEQIVDPNTLFHYESMLDAMVAAYNFSVIPAIVTETGWPWSGGANESYANMANAETFNNNLIKRVLTGPARLVNQNGSSVYALDLGDSKGNFSGGFCVARIGADSASLPDGLNWACGQGQANCTAIQSGQPCYLPDTVQNHASYAYNDYYQRKRGLGGTCDFGGTGILTNVDPSYGSFIFTGSSNSSTSPPAFGPPGPIANMSPPHRIPEIGCLMLLVFTWLLGLCLATSVLERLRATNDKR
ncbi:glucan endo-1,3-beta-glucosidase 4-like protein [Tanacetum coccineum]|uniref:Glucan endo-1,3-beta-glucosidase 4-like protein n=1 Tax=Tanacetum coccineum TaxID=301880 RepID=A0ABQ5FW77_9ASTR